MFKHSLFYISFIVFLTGCGLFKSLTTFDLETSFTYTIPASTPVATPFSPGTPDIQISSEAEFDGNDTEAKYVECASLKQCKLTITSPPSETFSFLKSIKIYITAKDASDKLLAYKNNITGNTNTLTLNTTGEGFADYIKKEKFGIRIDAVTDEVITQDVDILNELVFDIEAKVL